MAKRSLSCLSPDGRTVFSLTYFNSGVSQDDGGTPSRSSWMSPPSTKAGSSLPTQSPRYNVISINSLPIGDACTSNVGDGSKDISSPSSAYTYGDNPEVSSKKKFGSVTKGEEEHLNAPRALLTADMVSALKRDPPLELLYCDTQYSMPRSYPGAVQLALYSKSKVWLLLIGRRPPSDYNDTGRATTSFQLMGSSSPSIVNLSDYVIRSSLQPFESQLLELSSSAIHGHPAIVRVRAAPSNSSSSLDQYMAPPGSLALLTTEGRLYLYHPPSTISSSPMDSSKFRQDSYNCIMELREGIVSSNVSMSKVIIDVNSDDEDDDYGEDVMKVTDFCFGRTTYIPSPDPNSSSSSIVDPSHLGELNVYFLCQNGDVYGASPIVFDRAVMRRSTLLARMKYIEHQLYNVLPPEDFEYSDSEEKKMPHSSEYGTMHESERSISCSGRSRLHVEALRKVYSASRFWLRDIFDERDNENTSHRDQRSRKKSSASSSLEYSTARFFSTKDNAGVMLVQIQGPILYSHQDISFEDGEENNNSNDKNVDTTPCGDAVVIEPLPCMGSDMMAGMTMFCIGRQPLTPSTMEIQVDVCLITQPLLARYTHETDNELNILDEHHAEGRGRILDTILYDFGDEAYPSAEFEEEYLERHHSSLYLDLLVDPVRPYMIHVGAVFGVCTLALGSIPHALQNIRHGTLGTSDNVTGGSSSNTTMSQDADKAETNTFAFSSLALGGSFSRIGFQSTVISGDAELGHVLISQLTNGQMETVNLTAAIYMHQSALKRLTQSTSSETQALVLSTSTKKGGADVLESLGSFEDMASPLIQQISNGLSSVGRLCGSNLMPNEADESTVSAVFETKSLLENEVILPLKQLYLETRNREKVVTQVCDRQQDQLSKLQSMVSELQQRSKALIEKASALKKNDKVLSQRSECVLTTARALLPNVSKKELDYFEELKRWDNQVSEWEGKVKDMQRETTYLSDVALKEKDGSTGGTSRLTSDLLHPETKSNIDDLLVGQEDMIQNHRTRVLELQRSLKELAESENLHSTVG